MRNRYRSRGLDGFDEKFGRNVISAEIERRLTGARRPLRILEIGTGEGRALLELVKRYPEIQAVGGNKEPDFVPHVRMRENAQVFGIFAGRELERARLPEITIFDAEAIPYSDNEFDIVLSQTTLPHVARKDLAIEEAWRVLAPGGAAYLHLDTSSVPASASGYVSTPRFVVRRDNETVAACDYLAGIRREGFELNAFVNRKGDSATCTCLALTKNTCRKLALNLTFDAVRSGECQAGSTPPTPSWGFISFFESSRTISAASE